MRLTLFGRLTGSNLTRFISNLIRIFVLYIIATCFAEREKCNLCPILAPLVEPVCEYDCSCFHGFQSGDCRNNYCVCTNE
jgi:hypothetical protein